MNWYGLYTLFAKEVWRFLKVTVQTLFAPIVTSLLYLMIFRHLLEEHLEVYPGISYTLFLIPGLVMMTVIQNAFANTSSSIIQSKMTGNIAFILLAPLSGLELYLAFVGAAVTRGFIVGLGVYLSTLFFEFFIPQHIMLLILFTLLGGVILGALGLIGGLWADKYEHLAAFQNFIIVPLSFLSGVFYSLHSLPDGWRMLSQFNPFFYLIDGFRYAILGVSDISPLLSLAIMSFCTVAISWLAVVLLERGYKVRS